MSYDGLFQGNMTFIGGSEDMGRYPTTVDEANEWLQRYGKSELKFF